MATNSSSGAYGIPQALPGGKMASAKFLVGQVMRMSKGMVMSMGARGLLTRALITT